MQAFITLLHLLTASLVIASCAQDGSDQKASASQPKSAQTNDTAGKKAAFDSVTIAMTGDIMMGTTFPTAKLPQNDGKDIFFEYCVGGDFAVTLQRLPKEVRERER